MSTEYIPDGRTTEGGDGLAARSDTPGSPADGDRTRLRRTIVTAGR